MEIFGSLVTILGVLLGGIVGFLGNHIVEERRYRRLKEDNKEQQLKNLFDDYVDGINGLFRMVGEMITLLQNVHQEKLSKKLEYSFEEEGQKMIDNFKDCNINLDNIRSKFDFMVFLGIEEELTRFKEQYDQLSLFLERIEDENKRVPVGNEELKFLDEAEIYFDGLQDSIHFKMNEFYSSKFLPELTKLKTIS
tara:strand:- start:47 stop:628 length:582 start_codon:yes stop_codon:yes gene_type:complete